MHYYQLYELLKKSFHNSDKITDLSELDISISHYDFDSEDAKFLLPGSHNLTCNNHQISFEEISNHQPYNPAILNNSDFDIDCNKSFKYHVIQNISSQKAKGIIIMFHGLNEKNWDKYLTWAYGIAHKTQKTVILFPIAFHMDRAPKLWGLRKEMYDISINRSNETGNSESSYVNAAISSRLEENPQRVFWSGLQTYTDILRLINTIREGKISTIDSNATIDLFGYSIGSFLSMILMMANPGNIFSNSKLFCFCGGMTMDRMNPISKYIMDTRAAIEIQRSFALLLNSNFSTDARLSHYLNDMDDHKEGWFKSMLRYSYYQEEREQRIKEIQYQIKSLVLKKDIVTPPIEALNTLQGGYRDINTEVQIEDFPHPYSHMVPFPLTTKNASEIDKSYHLLINSASDFFNN